MLPAYQGYQEIELKRYFQSEYRDDWEYAMIQFVNEREDKKESLFESSFSRLGKVCKILLGFENATGLITSIYKLYNYRLMAGGLVNDAGPSCLPKFSSEHYLVNNLYQLPPKFKFFSSDQISKAQSGLICTLRKSSINPFFVIVRKSKGGHPKGSTADCCQLV